MSIIGTIAEFVGASEPAFRLLLTILAGYPLAAIYHRFIVNKEQKFHHLYFASTGILLCYFNYGNDVCHSFISVLITYFWSKYALNSQFFIIVNFIFHMSYLLIGYYYTESDKYDIKWTMPQCILSLRLIGFIYDISDGQKLLSESSKNELSNDQKERALAITEIPSLLELLGFVYFPASFLVGPQYPYRRYKRFISKEFSIYKDSLRNGLIRFGCGLFYLTVRQIGSTYIPDDYLLSDEYKNYGFIKKLILLGIWGKLTLYKYIACWLLAEGALMCFGLTFLKIDENGKEDWSGCTNVRILTFEKVNKLGDYIPSFNVNTNNWVAMYIYKRLKFLGNRMISQAASLLFLAVWHGFHSGYYICFSLEFIFVTFERQFQSMYDKFSKNHQQLLQSNLIQVLIIITQKLYTFVMIGWCLIPFVYFDYTNYFLVFSTVYYFGFIFLLSWFLLKSFLYKLLIAKTNNTNENTDVEVDNSKKQKIQ